LSTLQNDFYPLITQNVDFLVYKNLYNESITAISVPNFVANSN